MANEIKQSDIPVGKPSYVPGFDAEGNWTKMVPADPADIADAKQQAANATLQAADAQKQADNAAQQAADAKTAAEVKASIISPGRVISSGVNGEMLQVSMTGGDAAKAWGQAFLQGPLIYRDGVACPYSLYFRAPLGLGYDELFDFLRYITETPVRTFKFLAFHLTGTVTTPRGVYPFLDAIAGRNDEVTFTDGEPLSCLVAGRLLLTCYQEKIGLLYTGEGGMMWELIGGGSDYKLPVATASVLGGVKKGTNVNIDANGVISVPTATASTAGAVKAGTGLSVDNGALSVNPIPAAGPNSTPHPLNRGHNVVVSATRSTDLQLAEDLDYDTAVTFEVVYPTYKSATLIVTITDADGNTIGGLNFTGLTATGLYTISGSVVKSRDYAGYIITAAPLLSLNARKSI